VRYKDFHLIIGRCVSRELQDISYVGQHVFLIQVSSI